MANTCALSSLRSTPGSLDLSRLKGGEEDIGDEEEGEEIGGGGGAKDEEMEMEEGEEETGKATPNSNQDSNAVAAVEPKSPVDEADDDDHEKVEENDAQDLSKRVTPPAGD